MPYQREHEQYSHHYAEQLEKLMEPVEVYKGVHITKEGEYFKALNRSYPTLFWAKLAIDASICSLKKSVKKVP